MAWKYLEDFNLLNKGSRYKLRLMPDNREAMGIVEEIKILEGETNKGFIGLDNNRFTVNEYQYIQYEEYANDIATFTRVGYELLEKLKEDFPNIFG